MDDHFTGMPVTMWTTPACTPQIVCEGDMDMLVVECTPQASHLCH